jgi:hypothetical protein
MKNATSLFKNLVFAFVCFINFGLQAQENLKAQEARKATANWLLAKAKLVAINNPLLIAPNLYRDGSAAASKQVLSEDASRYESPDAFSSLLSHTRNDFNKYLTVLLNDTVANTKQLGSIANLQGLLATITSAESMYDLKKPMALHTDTDNTTFEAFDLETIKKNPRYGQVNSFREGFASIRKDQVYGFVDFSGHETITCQYEESGQFNGGRALVKRGNWYFISPEGLESDVLTDVLEAKALKYGVSSVKIKANNKNGFKYALIDNQFDKTGQTISAQYDQIQEWLNNELFIVKQGLLFGLINYSGDVIIKPMYESLENTNAPGIYKIRINGKEGLVGANGQVVVSAIYEEIGMFNRYGLAMVKKGDKIHLLKLTDLSLSDGYAAISFFEPDGTAIITDAKAQMGIINQNMNVVLQPLFIQISKTMNNGFRAVKNTKGLWGFIQKDGQLVIKDVYQSYSNFSKDGLAVVRGFIPNCGKAENCVVDKVINQQGIEVLVATDAQTNLVLSDTLLNGFIVVKSLRQNRANESVLTGGYHLINPTTRQILNKLPYDAIKGFNRDVYFQIKNNQRWGLLDTTGVEVVPCLYKEIGAETEGFYPVKDDNKKWGFIDRKGKIRVTLEYKEVMGFNDGLALVSKGEDQWGIVNRFNAKIVPCIFKNIKYIDFVSLELTDNQNRKFEVDNKGDCTQNCEIYEETLRKINQQEPK